VRWGSVAVRALLVAALAVGLLHAPASAQGQASKAGFRVTVLAASPEPGRIDPAARRYHALLGRRVRYESLRVLDTHHTRLGEGDIGRVSLPTGSAFRFRPLDLAGAGVLVAVDMGRTAQGDFRIPKGKPLILGGQPYQEGQLVVILEVVD
jgi:hypothetical protein